MALKTRLGFPSGDVREAQLPIVVFDDAGGTLDYNAALSAARTAAPAKLLGIPKTNDATFVDRSHDAIEFEIRYARPSQNILLRSESLSTKPKKLYHFLSSVGVYSSAGDVTSSYDALKTKPDRQASVAEFNSGKPIVVDPLEASKTLSFSTNQSFMNDTYLDTVLDLVDRGVFNNAIFLGRPIATLQLVGFSINERDAFDWELVYQFGYRKVQGTLTVADGIQIPTLRGCDHYWLVEEEVFEDSNFQKKATAAVVGQAWPLESFEVLNIPWQCTLTTRTSDTAGVVTTLYTHNLTASDDLILFWDGGTQTANITSVTATTITFASGVGDVLPLVNTNCLAAKYQP